MRLPRSDAVIHQFEPDHYHTTLGAHEPVLTIDDGDTVETSTIDAAGFDRDGNEALPGGGNPQTGPFFVRGAEPGDVLAVSLDRIVPNRAWGFTRNVVAAHLVEPSRVRDLPPSKKVRWSIDTAANTATLDECPADLPNFTIGLDPMLGCFGVAAPRGQAIWTATSGPNGGNMDYRAFRVGTTAYFPVYEPGALLFVGDGHAAQADGEVLGTGIETSMDVRVTVRVVRGEHAKRQQWVRGEDADTIFSVANCRPLELAIQYAMSDMLDWLTGPYGMSPEAAHFILGSHIRYDVGNVFDPAYTMAVRLPKAVLPDVPPMA